MTLVVGLLQEILRTTTGYEPLPSSVTRGIMVPAHLMTLVLAMKVRMPFFINNSFHLNL